MTGKLLWLVTRRSDLERFLETFLGSYGYQVRRHSDAVSALEALGHGALPDAVLCEDPPPGLGRAIYSR